MTVSPSVPQGSSDKASRLSPIFSALERIALVLGAAATVLTWVSSIAGPLMAQRAADEYRYDDVLTGLIIFGLITALVALAALVLGAIVVRKSRRGTLAGAAIALGAVALLSLPANYLSDALRPYLR